MKTPVTITIGTNRGIALLEVLLCSFILATGVLAVLNMQTLALGTVQSSAHLLRAEWLLNDMLERMKANPPGFAAALATGPNGRVSEYCETVSGCTVRELAAHDLAVWHQRLAALLPGGYGEIEPATIADFPSTAVLFRVRVRWQGSDQNNGYMSAPVSSAIVVL